MTSAAVPLTRARLIRYIAQSIGECPRPWITGYRRDGDLKLIPCNNRSCPHCAGKYSWDLTNAVLTRHKAIQGSIYWVTLTYSEGHNIPEWEIEESIQNGYLEDRLNVKNPLGGRNDLLPNWLKVLEQPQGIYLGAELGKQNIDITNDQALIHPDYTVGEWKSILSEALLYRDHKARIKTCNEYVKRFIELVRTRNAKILGFSNSGNYLINQGIKFSLCSNTNDIAYIQSRSFGKENRRFHHHLLLLCQPSAPLPAIEWWQRNYGIVRVRTIPADETNLTRVARYIIGYVSEGGDILTGTLSRDRRTSKAFNEAKEKRISEFKSTRARLIEILDEWINPYTPITNLSELNSSSLEDFNSICEELQCKEKEVLEIIKDIRRLEDGNIRISDFADLGEKWSLVREIFGVESILRC